MNPLAVVACLGFGVAGLEVALLVRDGFASERVRTQLHPLVRRISRLRFHLGGRRLAFVGGGLAAVGLLAMASGAWIGGGGLVLVLLLAPRPFLAWLEKRRHSRLDGQVVPFLDALLRSLGAVPALAEALAEARLLVDAPLSEELIETCDEVRLGMSFERALERLEARLSSRNLTIALLTLRVGQRTGGSLETVLRTTLDSLRELVRLEALIASKTAEGKLQLRVIALVPVPLVVAVRFADSSFFEPLETTLAGHLVVTCAVFLWGAAIFAASKILQVDI